MSAIPAGWRDEPLPGRGLGALEALAIAAVATGVLGAIAGRWVEPGAVPLVPRLALGIGAASTAALEVARRRLPPVWRHEALIVARLAVQCALVLCMVTASLDIALPLNMVAASPPQPLTAAQLATLDLPRWFLLAGIALVSVLHARSTARDELDRRALEAAQRRARRWLAGAAPLLERALGPGETVLAYGWRSGGAPPFAPLFTGTMYALLVAVVAIQVWGCTSLYGRDWTLSARLVPWTAALALWALHRQRAVSILAWWLGGVALQVAALPILGNAFTGLASAAVTVAALHEHRRFPRTQLAVLTEERMLCVARGWSGAPVLVGTQTIASPAGWPRPCWSLHPALDAALPFQRTSPPPPWPAAAALRLALACALCFALDVDATHRAAVLTADALPFAAGPAPALEAATAAGLAMLPDDPLLLALRADALRRLGRAAEAAPLRARAGQLTGPPSRREGSLVGEVLRAAH